MTTGLTRSEVASLLDRLCANAGFCLPSAEHDKLLENPPGDPAAFTDAVFLAEGLDPQTAQLSLYRGILNFVTAVFRHSSEHAEVESANAMLRDLRRPKHG
jgi:hypothetical protein